MEEKFEIEFINIELNLEEANLFKLFRQYQNDFKFLLEGNFFDFRNGKAIINRDAQGVIQDLRIETITNKRKRKKNV